jgi:hypothetical protein
VVGGTLSEATLLPYFLRTSAILSAFYLLLLILFLHAIFGSAAGLSKEDVSVPMAASRGRGFEI